LKIWNVSSRIWIYLKWCYAIGFAKSLVCQSKCTRILQ
jgi:hypothetical protein